jgi:hypothetical protein
MTVKEKLSAEFEEGSSENTHKLGWWMASNERRMAAFYRVEQNDVIVNGDAPAPTFTKSPEEYKEFVHSTRNTTGSSRTSGNVRENATKLIKILEEYDRM